MAPRKCLTSLQRTSHKPAALLPRAYDSTLGVAPHQVAAASWQSCFESRSMAWSEVRIVFGDSEDSRPAALAPPCCAVPPAGGRGCALLAAPPPGTPPRLPQAATVPARCPPGAAAARWGCWRLQTTAQAPEPPAGCVKPDSLRCKAPKERRYKCCRAFVLLSSRHSATIRKTSRVSCKGAFHRSRHLDLGQRLQHSQCICATCS